MPKKRLLFLIVLISLFSLSCNIFNLIMDRVADDEEVRITAASRVGRQPFREGRGGGSAGQIAVTLAVIDVWVS